MDDARDQLLLVACYFRVVHCVAGSLQAAGSMNEFPLLLSLFSFQIIKNSGPDTKYEPIRAGPLQLVRNVTIAPALKSLA